MDKLVGRPLQDSSSQTTCSARPGDWPYGQIKVHCTPYLDTVVLFFPSGLPKGMLRKVRAVHGRGLPKPKKAGPFGQLFELHQPNSKTLLVAEEYRAMADAKIYRVDIAYDLYCTDPHFNVANFIRRNVTLKCRARKPIYIFGDGDKTNADRLIDDRATTMYWQFDKKDTNIVHYNDLPGKVDGGRPEHLELRIMPCRNCRAAGFMTLHDVIEADPREVFETHAEIIQYDYERWIFARIKKALRKSREGYLGDPTGKRRTEFGEEDLMERWRAGLKKRLVKGFRIAEMEFAQTAKRIAPNSVKKMSRYPSSIFGVLKKLTWGANPRSLKYKKNINFYE